LQIWSYVTVWTVSRGYTVRRLKVQAVTNCRLAKLARVLRVGSARSKANIQGVRKVLLETKKQPFSSSVAATLKWSQAC